jgi:hypothetical protein
MQNHSSDEKYLGAAKRLFAHLAEIALHPIMGRFLHSLG